MSWTEAETTTHQDHVIKHILGATVLGWTIAGEAAHFLLDIGFLWTIYLDGEMNLLPQGVALAEMDGDDVNSADRTELAFDAELLLSEGRDATGLKRFVAAQTECMIRGVDLFGLEAARRLVIQGDEASIVVETSVEAAELKVVEKVNAGA